MKNFKFELGARLTIIESDGAEQGKVIARGDYSDGAEDQYRLRYRAGDGRTVEQWWGESALTE